MKNRFDICWDYIVKNGKIGTSVEPGIYLWDYYESYSFEAVIGGKHFDFYARQYISDEAIKRNGHKRWMVAIELDVIYGWDENGFWRRDTAAYRIFERLFIFSYGNPIKVIRT